MKFKVEDRVMVHIPHEHTGKQRSLLFLKMAPRTEVVIKPVNKPQKQSILVNCDRVNLFSTRTVYMYPGLERNPGKGSKRKICRSRGRSLGDNQDAR